MKLGMEIGLGPGDIVLDGDPAPYPQTGTAPNFGPCLWIKMPLGREVDLGPGNIVLDGDPTPPKGHSPQFLGPCLLWPNGCMDEDASWCGLRT